MDLFKVALGFEMDGRVRVRSAIVFGFASRLHVAEFPLNQFQHLLVSDVARSGHYQMIRREPVAEARKERITIKCPHGFRRTENRAAERMMRPETPGEYFVKEVFGIVQIHFYFFEDN